MRLYIVSIICLFWGMLASAQSPDTSKVYFGELPVQLDVFTFSDSNNHLSDKLKLNNQPGIDQVMQMIPELSLVKKGAYAFVPAINGFHTERLTVTIDGMRIFGACTDKMDPVTSYVETGNLRKMEVSCHTSGSSNGTSLGGNLNMALSDPKIGGNKKVYGETRLGYQSVSNGFNTSAAVGYSGKKFGLRTSIGHRKHESYNSGGGSVVPFTQFTKTNFSISSKYKLTRNTLVDAQYILDNAQDVGYPGLPMDVSFAQAQIYSFTISQYNPINGISKLRWKVYGNNVSHLMDDTKRPSNEVAMHMDMPGWSDTYGSFMTLENDQNGKHSYFFKIDFFQNFRKADMIMYPQNEAPMFMLTWPEVLNRNWGVFVSDNWKIDSKNELQISGRTEWVSHQIQSKFGQKQISVFNKVGDSVYTFMPFGLNVQLVHNFNTHIQLSGGSGYAVRSPNLSEMFGFYLFNKEDGYDYIGDPYLKTEKATKFHLDLSIQERLWNAKAGLFAYSIEDYIYGSFDDMIPPMTIRAKGSKRYVNLERAYQYGMVFQFGYKLTSFLEIESQGNYTIAEQANGANLPQIAPFTYTNNVSYERKNWLIGFQIVGASSQNRIDTTWGEDKTPSWAILNFNGGKQVELTEGIGLTFTVSIENIFDQYYWAHLDWNNIPRYGRSFNFNMGLRF